MYARRVLAEEVPEAAGVHSEVSLSELAMESQDSENRTTPSFCYGFVMWSKGGSEMTVESEKRRPEWAFYREDETDFKRERICTRRTELKISETMIRPADRNKKKKIILKRWKSPRIKSSFNSRGSRWTEDFSISLSGMPSLLERNMERHSLLPGRLWNSGSS